MRIGCVIISISKNENARWFEVKRLKAMLRASAMVGLVFSVIPASNAMAWTGSGTLSDPYHVNNCSDLQAVSGNLTAHYRMTRDVECTGVSFTPIGTSSSKFTGHFDGDGFTIYDLTVNLPTTNDVGLFGVVDGAVIKDIDMYNVNITGQTRVGAFIGQALNSSDISFLTSSAGTIVGQEYVGGIVGSLEDSVLTHGAATSGSTSGSRPGVSTASRIGGLIGYTSASTTSKSFATGTVTGNNDGNSSDQIGGLIGQVAANNTINDTYSTATVTGQTKVGGLIGYPQSSGINRSWAGGTVTGTTDVGGFAGYEALNAIVDSFAMGAVTGSTNVGGFIGHTVAVGGDATNSYFDVTRTGQTVCVGLDEGISFPTNCTGVNVASAQTDYFHNNITNEPLDGWNFTTIWRTTTTTPTLRWGPARPDNVRVSSAATTLTVSWEVPADTGGSAITSYDLRYKASASSGTLTAYDGLSATTFSQVLSNLTPSTEYIFYLRANNALGHGIWTGVITYTTAPSSTVTTAPKIKTAVAQTTATDVSAENPVEEDAADSNEVPTLATPLNDNDESQQVDSRASGLEKAVWVAVSVAGLGIAYVASLQSKKISK